MERSLQSGTGGARLQAALASAGIRHLVVRNDLRADAVDSGGGQGLRVHEADRQRRAHQGRDVRPARRVSPRDAAGVVDGDRRPAHPSAVPVHRGLRGGGLSRRRRGGRGRARPGRRWRRGRPRCPSGRPGCRGGRRRLGRAGAAGRASPEARSGWPPTATRTERSSSGAPATTRRPCCRPTRTDAPGGTPMTTWPIPRPRRRSDGADGDLVHVSASSSASDANASLRLGPGYGPQAAVDGDPGTAWVSGTFGSSVGEWLNLDLARPMDVTGLTVTLEEPPRRVGTPSEVRVDTDSGTATSRLLPGAGAQTSRRARGIHGIRASDRDRSRSKGPSANGAGIAEIGIPGAELGTRLIVPTSSGDAHRRRGRPSCRRRTTPVRLGGRPALVHEPERPPAGVGGRFAAGRSRSRAS